MRSPQRRVPRRIALVVVLVVLCSVLAATAATASASSVVVPTATAESDLSLGATVDVSTARTAALAPAAIAPASFTAPTYRRTAPKPKVKSAMASSMRLRTSYTSKSRRASAAHSVRRVASRTTATKTAKTGSASEIAQARAILAGYIAKYPICKGATIYITMVPALQGGADGCVFLGSGTIVINPNHSSSLSYIIGHEINHLREYRASHS